MKNIILLTVVLSFATMNIFAQGYSKKDELLLLDEIKSDLIENINKYGFWENANTKKNSNLKRYNASFVDDYLKLVVLNTSSEIGTQGILLDFLKVYKFGNIDERKNQTTYINIWVDNLRYGNKHFPEKLKLVMKFKKLEYASNVYRLLQEYNRLLIKKDILGY